MENQKKTLAHEDRIRMARLYEEVAGRLEEMALITARALDMNTSDLAFTFERPGQVSQATSLARPVVFKGVKIICTQDGCGCYDYDTGECFVC